MDSWQLFLTVFVALLVITDPLGTVAIFLSITEGDDLKTQRKQAWKGSLYTFVILIVFFFAGTYILQFFGITLDAIRLGGGIIIGGIGLQLMRATPESTHEGSQREESMGKPDVSFSPLAMPLLAGPGALAVVIGASAKNSGMEWAAYGLIVLAIFLTSLIIWICLREANLLLRILGRNGMGGIMRIMGFLLVCIAVEMMILGAHGVLASWGIIEDLDYLKALKDFAF